MSTGVSRLLTGGLRAGAPVARGAAMEAGAHLGVPISPAAHLKGNILVFTYTSLCLSTVGGQWGKHPKPAK